MSIYHVKLRITDRLWTKYRRIRCDFICQYCGRVYAEDDCRNLGVSHFHGRANENTRFDEDNTPCLCSIPCHHFLDTHKTEYRDWMLKRLGQERFDMLQLKAHIHKDRDDKSDAIIIRQMIKELNG